MYDIVIVGAGPAGSNLARLIGGQYRVLVIDQRDMEDVNPRNRLGKCCGGLLAPDAQKAMAQLGLGIPKDVLVDPQLFAVRAIDLTNNLERLYQRFYLNMDRDKFDKWLVSNTPSGVDRAFNSFFKTLAKVQGGYDVAYIHDGRETTVRTRVVVGADGALSRVRRHLGKGPEPLERYVAIQEWFESPCKIPYYTAIFDEAISDFYSWIIPKEDHLLLGAALRPRDDIRERFELLKSKLSRLGFDLGKPVKTEGAFVLRPRMSSRLCLGSEGIALVGEAAGAISPSSAEGISYALKSSLYLAQALGEGIDGFHDRYKRRVADIGLGLFMNNLISPAMYDPFLRGLVMKSGVLGIG